MKKSISLFMAFLLIAAVMFTGCPGSSDPSDPTPGSKPGPKPKTDAEYVAEAKAALVFNRTIAADNFTLPASSVAGVTITWSSDNAAITISGTSASVTRGDTDVTVTLTAAITKGKASDSKNYTLTVLNNNPSNEEILNFAKHEVFMAIPTTINAPETGIWTLFPGLTGELKILGDEYTAYVSYQSDADSIHFTKQYTGVNEDNYWFSHDIVDVTVPLKVRIYILEIDDEKNEEVDITLKHITRLFDDDSETDPKDKQYGNIDTEEYLFDGSTLTYRSVYKPVNGTEQIREITIAYSAVPSSSREGTMTATVTSITDDSKKSTSREQFASYCAEKLSSLELEQATVLDTLITMCTDGKNHTFSDYMKPLSSTYAQMGMKMTLAEFTDYFADEMYEAVGFDSAEEFKNADSETLPSIFSNFALQSMKGMADMYGFAAPTSLEDWDDLYEQFKKTVKTIYDEEMKKEAAQIFYSNVPFGYSLSYNSDYDNTNTYIMGHASFLPGKPWYEQNGRFYKSTNGGDTTVEVTALGCEIRNEDEREIGTISQDYQTVTMENDDKFTVSYNNNLNPPVLTLTADAGNKTFTDNYDLVLSASQLIPAIKFLEIF